MKFVVTLVCDPAARRVTPDLADTAMRGIAGAGARTTAPNWLAPQIACDIAVEGTGLEAIDAAARAAIGPAPVDVVVQPAENRRKRLLVADMESTVIENEMVDELARLVGVKDKVTEITRRAMNGEIEFRPALRERVALLGGLEADLLKEMRESIVFMGGAKALVATMRANGAKCALVSGGFKVYSKWVKKRLRFHKHFANDLVIRDGAVTGELTEPVLGREAKLEALDRLVAKYRIRREDVIAVGDGANDLMMLDAAGMGVAFRAKPSVAERAQVRIDHGDLTALLYLQGYSREDFVDS